MKRETIKRITAKYFMRREIFFKQGFEEKVSEI